MSQEQFLIKFFLKDTNTSQQKMPFDTEIQKDQM